MWIKQKPQGPQRTRSQALNARRADGTASQQTI